MLSANAIKTAVVMMALGPISLFPSQLTFSKFYTIITGKRKNGMGLNSLKIQAEN